MTVITVLRRDLFIWSHFLLSCLFAQSVFFSTSRWSSGPRLHRWPSDSVGGPKWPTRTKTMQNFNCKFVILLIKSLLLHQAPLRPGWQSFTAAARLVGVQGPLPPFASHLTQRCSTDVIMLSHVAFCTWKSHLLGSEGLEKRRLAPISVYHLCVFGISFCVCVSLCASNWHLLTHATVTEKSFTCLTSRPITCWPENAPFKNKKEKKAAY